MDSLQLGPCIKHKPVEILLLLKLDMIYNRRQIIQMNLLRLNQLSSILEKYLSFVETLSYKYGNVPGMTKLLGLCILFIF